MERSPIQRNNIPDNKFPRRKFRLGNFVVRIACAFFPINRNLPYRREAPLALPLGELSRRHAVTERAFRYGVLRCQILRQHRTIASASLRRLFAPLLQFEKPEIYTGFLRFPNFELRQKSCLRLLAELRGAALISLLIAAEFTSPSPNPCLHCPSCRRNPSRSHCRNPNRSTSSPVSAPFGRFPDKYRNRQSP